MFTSLSTRQLYTAACLIIFLLLTAAPLLIILIKSSL